MYKIKKIIMNFSIGNLILLISYIMLYFMAGINAYKQDISVLQDIEILIKQCIGVGTFYVIYDYILEYIKKFISPEEAKEMNFKKMFKFLFVVIVLIPLIISVLKFCSIPQNVESIYYFNIIMITIIVAIISTIIQLKDVKKINNYLKNRKN